MCVCMCVHMCVCERENDAEASVSERSCVPCRSRRHASRSRHRYGACRQACALGSSFGVRSRLCGDGCRDVPSLCPHPCPVAQAKGSLPFGGVVPDVGPPACAAWHGATEHSKKQSARVFKPCWPSQMRWRCPRLASAHSCKRTCTPVSVHPSAAGSAPPSLTPRNLGLSPERCPCRCRHLPLCPPARW